MHVYMWIKTQELSKRFHMKLCVVNFLSSSPQVYRTERAEKILHSFSFQLFDEVYMENWSVLFVIAMLHETHITISDIQMNDMMTIKTSQKIPSLCGLLSSTFYKSLNYESCTHKRKWKAAAHFSMMSVVCT